MSKIYANKEYLKFFFFLFLVVVLTPYLMDIISRSWSTNLMKYLGGIIKSVDPSGTSVIITFVIGFYIGSAMLLFLDRKKRIQAFILLLGVVVLFEYLIQNFTIGWNLIYVGVGAIIGIFLGSRFKLSKKEFRSAATNVGLFSVMYASLSLVILYSSNSDNTNFIRDSLVLLVFSYFFGKLMGYEIKGPQIFILGPERSGKTLFLAGCYMRIVDITHVSTKRSNDLVDLMKELAKGWPKRTREILKYQFTYEIGKLFPRETTIRTIDYPGVYLNDILNYMDNDEDIEKINNTEDKLRIEAAKEVVSADRLIFILDAARYPKFEEMGIDHYLKIVTRLHEEGKDIKPYIVVTKSDLFKDDFPNYEKDYEGFKKFIENKFSENIFIRELLIEASSTSFFPVFYYTKKTPIDEDKKIEDKNEDKNPDANPTNIEINSANTDINNVNTDINNVNTDINADIDTTKENEYKNDPIEDNSVPAKDNGYTINKSDGKKYGYTPIRDSFGNVHTYGFDKFMEQLIES